MSATFDTTTKAAYDAATTATARATAIVASLSSGGSPQGAVRVKVFNGASPDVEMGAGTMSAPWATASGGTVVIGEVSSFSVGTTGTPNANWYIKFQTLDGTRWAKGSFGLSSSTQDFKWSLATFADGQTGSIGTATIVCTGNSAPVFTVAPTTVELGSAGGTIQFTATDPDGGTILYSLTTTRNGITINSTTGLVTVTNAAAATSGNIVVQASDGILTASTSCAVTVAASTGTILWRGDFDAVNPDGSVGNFRQYFYPTSPSTPWLWYAPQYGRPAQKSGDASEGGYYGNGELMDIVTSPVRSGTRAAKFRIKNSTSSADWNTNDPGSAGSYEINSRRTQTSSVQMGFEAYRYLPNVSAAFPGDNAIRWLSYSVYIPSDWSNSGSGWGPVMFELTPAYGDGPSPDLAIEAAGGQWQVYHRWSPDGYPRQVDSQYMMSFTSSTSGDITKFMPNATVSKAALGSFLKGGWTDFVWQLKMDWRTVASGGVGFARLWKREGSGAWVQVLNIYPATTTNSGSTYAHGVGYNMVPVQSNQAGHTFFVGLYGQKEQFLLGDGRTCYVDNVKVGNQNCTLADMAP